MIKLIMNTLRCLINHPLTTLAVCLHAGGTYPNGFDG